MRAVVGTGLAMAACMLAPGDAMRGVGHLILLLAMAVAIVVGAAVGREAWRHQRLAASIARLARPAMVGGRAVALVPGLGAAVVAGLRRPRIYCDPDLPRMLDADELRAVILHEHHHQLDRGPARLVLIAALAPALRQFAPGRAWLERERARVEIVADAYALDAGASRQSLASALVKLSSTARLSATPGFANAADLRVRALLGEATGIERGGSVGQVAAALLLIASCIGLYLR